MSRPNRHPAASEFGDTVPVGVAEFEAAMGMVLDRLEDIKAGQQDGLEQAMTRAVTAGVRQALTDKELTQEFWRDGFDELAKHGASGASQWVGKRILTAMVVAVLIWGVTWLVQTGRLK